MNFSKFLGLVSSFVQDSPTTAPVKRDQVGRILDRAADVIEQRGWAQHILMDLSGRVCTRQALHIAARGETSFFGLWSETHLVAKAETRLMQHIGLGMAVPTWNDTRGITKNDVLAELRAAAVK